MRYISTEIVCGARPRTALVLTGQEWNGFHDKVQKHRRLEEQMEERTVKEEKKREQSRKMTENWPNTLANIQKQRVKKIIEASRKAEDDKLQEYNDILIRRAQEKEEILEKAKKIVYERNESCRQIASGLVLSAILEERAKQLAMKKTERQQLYAKSLEETATKRQLAEAHRKEMEERKIKHVEEMQKNKQILDEQMVEVLEKRKDEMEERRREKEDLEDIRKELAHLEKVELINSIETKRKVLEEQKKWAIMVEQNKNQRRQQDKEDSAINSIYQSVRDKLDQQRAKVEQKIKEELLERRSKVPPQHKPKPEDHKAEEELLEKALKERSLQTEMELKERREKKERLRQELKEYIAEAGRQAEEDAKQKMELRRWEILQRLALEEADRNWKAALVETKRKNQEAVKRSLIAQWEEKEHREIDGRLNELTEYEKEAQAERDALLLYCDKIEKAAAETGRPMYPVKAAIESVKKSAGIYDDKRKVPFLQSRVPIRSIALYEKN